MKQVINHKAKTIFSESMARLQEEFSQNASCPTIREMAKQRSITKIDTIITSAKQNFTNQSKNGGQFHITPEYEMLISIKGELQRF